jgi:ketosteroid isomerase-like protein
MNTLLLLAALAAPDLEVLREQVRQAECAFARSMAERDFAAFGRHVADDTVFFAPGMRRGKAAVLEGWKPFFEGAKAPFSWAPQQVEMLADGSLGYSTGLVRNPEGRATSRFSSVWRRNAQGQWQVVFDHGGALSEAEKAKSAEPDARPC